MTKKEAIIEACAIFALAYKTMGDYGFPADGFCDKCQGDISEIYYRNSGKIFDYVRLAVVEKLKKDGYEIANGFDPITGKEIL